MYGDFASITQANAAAMSSSRLSSTWISSPCGSAAATCSSSDGDPQASHSDSSPATFRNALTTSGSNQLPFRCLTTEAARAAPSSLAKISTEGEKVADVFYVTRGGQRITDDTERAVILQRLRIAVDAPDLSGS